MSRTRSWMVLAGCVAAVAGSSATDAGAPTPRPDDVLALDAALLRRRPDVGFRLEGNRGQSDSTVDFVARCRGYMAWVRPTDVVLGLSGPESTLDVIDLRLVGADVRRAATSETLPGVSNYLIGRDESKWVRGAPSFGRARYADAWPGVGVTYRGDDRRLRFDFDVAPGAGADAVELAFDGADAVRVVEDGSLHVAAPRGELVVSAPVAYELVGATRRPVAARWTARGGVRAGFDVAGRDPSRTLVVDPSVAYATYFGGSAIEWSGGIAVDASFNAYLAGYTTSADLPTTTGALHTTKAALSDVYCTKFNATGSVLVYSTFLGGAGDDHNAAVAVDASGAAYLHGSTNSTDFPSTSGSVEPTRSTGGNLGYVAKLNAAGSALAYATFVNYGYGKGIAVDASGLAYVAVQSATVTPPRVYQISASGASYANSYTFGTSSEYVGAIAVDAAGAVYLTGSTNSSSLTATAGAFQSQSAGSTDCYVAKITAGFTLAYCTFLGGSSNDIPFGIAVDSGGNAYVVGWTTSTNFPVSNAIQPTYGGAQDGFLAKLNATGSALGYSTYLGGAGSDTAEAVVVTPFAVYVCGVTSSTNYPTTASAVQPTMAASSAPDGFLTILRNDASLHYSTYYGGSSIDSADFLAVDSAGDAYLHMTTSSADFPTVSAYDTSRNSQDGGLVKLSGVVGLTMTTPTPLAVWTQGVPFSIQLGVTGQIGAVTWSLASGAMPTGVSLTSDGLLSGTPGASGTFSFTVQVADSIGLGTSRQFAWTVNPVPAVTAVAPQLWTRDRPYQTTVRSTGGTPPILWTSTGNVPAGLSFASSGILSGTPTAPGTSAFVAHATDSFGVEAVGTVSFKVVEPPRVATTSLAPWTEGVLFLKTIAVADGTPPYAWSVVGGDFPFENTIGASSGTINSVTKTFGTYSFTLRVTDAAGASGQGDLALTLNPSPQIDSSTLPLGAVGRPYAAVLHAHDGTPPGTWIPSAPFPDGVAFAPAAGAFSGTPTAPGVSVQTFTYVDSCGAQSVRAVVLSVAAPTDLGKKKFASNVLFDSTENSGPRVYFVELVAGTTFGLVVKPKGSRAPAPFVTLRDAAGALVDLGGTESRSGNTYRIKRLVVPASGRYFLRISPPLDLSAPSTDAVTVTVAAASSFGGTVTLDASKPDVDVVVGVLEGAKATIVVKAARGQKVAPKIVGLFQNGVDLVQAGEIKTKGLTTTLVLKTPLAMGEARLRLSATGAALGDATWSVKLKQPKTYAFSMEGVPAGN